MTSAVADEILVIHLAGVGDLLMGRGALHALRGTHPDSRLALLTWTKNREAANLISGLDERYLLDPGSSMRAVLWNLRVIHALRRRRFSLALNCYQVYRWSGVFKLAALLRLIRAQRTAGRDTDGKGWCFDQRILESSTDPLHEAEHQARFVERLGCSVSATPPPLDIDPADQQRVERWLTQQGVAPETVLVAMHPGGARPAHRWPHEAFLRVARRLERQYKARIVLTGNRAECCLVERMARQLHHPLVAAGTLSLGQVAAVLRRCRLLMTNDSGPAHLGAALEIPLLVIAGPTDPARFGPYPLNRSDQIIVHASGCQPCYRHHCGGHEELRKLSAEDVMTAVDDILQGRHPRGIRQVSPRLRVLHVHTLPIISGSGLNTFLSMRGQQEAGLSVELACAPGGPLLDLVEQYGMVVRPLRHLVRPVHPLHDLMVLGELLVLMRRHRYAIVHTHNSKAGVVGRLAAKLAGVPVVIHTIHGFAFHDQEPWWNRVLYRWLEWLAAQWCDRLIAISQPLVEWAVAERVAAREKLVKIYSGIDVEAFRRPVDVKALRAVLGLDQQDFVVGEVAKLWVGKGHDVLLKAAARLRDQIPSLKVLIVGEGELRSSLERLMEILGLRGRVVFTGFREDVPAMTQLLDVAVLPTLFEGMGRAVLEAQAAAKPVIASRVGGVPDLITDGTTGLLVEPGSIEQLAAAIQRLYASPKLRHSLGEAARRMLDRRFDARTMSEEILQVYDALLRQRTGSGLVRQAPDAVTLHHAVSPV